MIPMFTGCSSFQCSLETKPTRAELCEAEGRGVIAANPAGREDGRAWNGRDGLGMEVAQEGGHLLWEGSEPPVTASPKEPMAQRASVCHPQEHLNLSVFRGKIPFSHQFLSPAWEGQAGLTPDIPAVELEFSGT